MDLTKHRRLRLLHLCNNDNCFGEVHSYWYFTMSSRFNETPHLLPTPILRLINLMSKHTLPRLYKLSDRFIAPALSMSNAKFLVYPMKPVEN